MDWPQLISSLGFPICCCIVLFKQNIDQQKKHETEMKGMTEALNQNTLVITRLLDKLEAMTRENLQNDS